MVKSEPKHWGYHLLLDSAFCNEAINDPTIVETFLRDLVKTIKMKPIGDPIVIYVDDEEGKGVTGVQIITTSTITFHGDDLNKCVYLDVFSCKPYKRQRVIDLFDKYFRPQAMTYRWIHRDAD